MSEQLGDFGVPQDKVIEHIDEKEPTYFPLDLNLKRRDWFLSSDCGAGVLGFNAVGAFCDCE